MPQVSTRSDAPPAAGSGASRPLTSPEVYEVLAERGLRAGARVLDIGAGGDAAQPLIESGVLVTPLAGRAEALAYPDASFDGAVAADVFQFCDQSAAFGELLRVVRPGGLVAVWWTTIASEGDLTALRAAATRDTGLGAVPDPLARGFRAFYAAPFSAHALRVVPAVVDGTVAGWMTYERSRRDVERAYGAQASRWHDALETRLVAAYGSPAARLRVPLFQYVYLGTV